MRWRPNIDLVQGGRGLLPGVRSAETIVGVNKYRLEKQEPVEVLSIDNSSVITAQRSKLEQVRATRDEEAVRRSLDALTECAAGSQDSGNLLELSVAAARARCTVGEISYALEKVFGRHVASVGMVSGAYAKSYGASEDMQRAIARCQVGVARTTCSGTAVVGADMGGALAAVCRPLRGGRGVDPASWWPRWVRTAMIEGTRSLPLASRTSALMWTLGLSSV